MARGRARASTRATRGTCWGVWRRLKRVVLSSLWWFKSGGSSHALSSPQRWLVGRGRGWVGLGLGPHRPFLFISLASHTHTHPHLLFNLLDFVLWGAFLTERDKRRGLELYMWTISICPFTFVFTMQVQQTITPSTASILPIWLALPHRCSVNYQVPHLIHPLFHFQSNICNLLSL